MTIFNTATTSLALLGLLTTAWILLSSIGSGNLRSAFGNGPNTLSFNGPAGQTEQDQRSLMANLAEFADPKSVAARSTSKVIVAPEEQKYAVFLISFGESAAESTYVERCILSARRRGAWQGAIIVLTDAPTERYQGLFDENVFILHPKEEHIKSDYFKFGEMIFKRFKTYVNDYVDMVPELENVEWIYYIDIDVLFGAPFMELVYILENRYNLGEIDTEVSKLHFFENSWDRFALQGGFYIVHRETSRLCLELWRKKIDSYRSNKFDQTSLEDIFQEYQSGKDTRCQLVAMERDNYIISYPAGDEDMVEILDSPRFPNLIHIRNTYITVHYKEGMHEEFVGKVLDLSEDEKKGNKFTTQTFFGAS